MVVIKRDIINKVAGRLLCHGGMVVFQQKNLIKSFIEFGTNMATVLLSFNSHKKTKTSYYCHPNLQRSGIYIILFKPYILKQQEVE